MLKLISSSSGHCPAVTGLLLLPLLSLTLVTRGEPFAKTNNEFSLEQADLYLAGLFDGPAEDEVGASNSGRPLELTHETGQIFKQTLEEAIEELETVAADQQQQQQQRQSDEPDESISTRDNILAILRWLLQSVDSCEDTLVELLVNLATSTSSTYLHQYARQRMGQCWQAYLAAAPAAIDKALGKSNSQVFDFIELLAESIHKRNNPTSAAPQTITRKAHDNSRSLKIWGNTDDKKSDEQQQQQAQNLDSPKYISQLESRRYSPEMIAKLKRIQLDSFHSKRQLALAVNSAFNKHWQATEGALVLSTPKAKVLPKLSQYLRDNFEEPCKDLLDRIDSALAMRTVYENQLGGPTLDKYLAQVRSYNVHLNYHLETRRICSEWMAVKQAIWRMLEAMR